MRIDLFFVFFNGKTERFDFFCLNRFILRRGHVAFNREMATSVEHLRGIMDLQRDLRDADVTPEFREAMTRALVRLLGIPPAVPAAAPSAAPAAAPTAAPAAAAPAAPAADTESDEDDEGDVTDEDDACSVPLSELTARFNAKTYKPGHVVSMSGDKRSCCVRTADGRKIVVEDSGRGDVVYVAFDRKRDALHLCLPEPPPKKHAAEPEKLHAVEYDPAWRGCFFLHYHPVTTTREAIGHAKPNDVARLRLQQKADQRRPALAQRRGNVSDYVRWICVQDIVAKLPFKELKDGEALDAHTIYRGVQYIQKPVKQSERTYVTPKTFTTGP